MTNPTLDLLQRHGSVRKYLADPVPAGTIEQIVHAAQRASTSSNLQVVSVVAVMEAAKRKRLSEISGQEHVAQAPAVLVWCADLKRLDRALRTARLRPGDGLRREFPDVRPGRRDRRAKCSRCSRVVGARRLLSRQRPEQYPGGDRAAGASAPGLSRGRHGAGLAAAPPAVRPRLATPAVLSWDRYTRQAMQPFWSTIASWPPPASTRGVRSRSGQTGPDGRLRLARALARRAEQALRTELRAVLKQQGFGLE